MFYLNINYLYNLLILISNHYLFFIHHLNNLCIHIYLYYLIPFSLFMIIKYIMLDTVGILIIKMVLLMNEVLLKSHHNQVNC
jgi:hypothetical protein